MQKRLLTIAIGTAIAGAANLASADAFVFNPYGTGTLATDQILIDTFDWSRGTALSTNASVLGVDSDHQVSFDLFAQAKLNILSLTVDGSPNAYGTDLDYPSAKPRPELTFVTGFGEKGFARTVSPTQSAATFTYDSRGSVNYFEIWANTGSALKSNNITGAGFNDGTLIFSAHVESSSGNFTNDSSGTLPNIDTFTNNATSKWGSLKTVTGTGGTQIMLHIDSANASYFPDFKYLNHYATFNTQNNLNFSQTDPSHCLVNKAGGTANSFCDTNALNTDLTGQNPNTNAINGLPNGINKDVLLQQYATLSLLPEPTTLSLLGLGMLGFGLRRASRQSKA
ncbi:MAG: PEP-CTERM sorting domain-containing protein [Methylococcaceae bacterium]|nr:PEP-CTERM sorting domain-containing protein [Methylococcaceae bacterium]